MVNILTGYNIDVKAILSILNTFSNRISVLERTPPSIAVSTVTNTVGFAVLPPLSFNNNVISLTNVSWSLLVDKPNTLAGYGITDSVLTANNVYLNPSWIGSLGANKISGLSTVATSGNYNDLINLPTIVGSSVQADWNQNSSSQADFIKNKPVLSTVALSGSYVDLFDKPTIPSPQVNSNWNAVSGVSQILNKPIFATVATTGSYNDLLSKPTIPAQFNPVQGSGIVLTGTYPNITFSAATSGTVTGVSGILNRITVTNGSTTPVVDIASTYIGQASITTLGTIVSGVWHGSPIANSWIASPFISINGSSIALGGSVTTNQTFQQVLSTGSILTGDNTVTVGANTFKLGADADNYQLLLDKTNSSINLKSYKAKIGKLSTATRTKIGIITAPNSAFTTVAPLLNIGVGRVGTTLSATTPGTLYQSYSTAGFEVQLNVQYFAADGTSNFPTGSDLTAYNAKLTSYLTTAQSYNVVLVAVENEENNAGYRALDSNSASYFMAQLSSSVSIIHSKGMKATNGGLTGHTFKYVIYNWLNTHGRTADAQIMLLNEFSASQQTSIAGGTYQTDNALQIGICTAVLNGIAATGADYINFHWYFSALTNQPTVPFTKTFLLAKEVCEIWTGLPAITNEVGQHNGVATIPTDVLKEIVKSGMRYAIWYSGDGTNPGDAVALQNTDLTLRPQGFNFSSFMAGFNSIDVPIVVDNNDIYLRNQYAGLLSVGSDNKLSTISSNTYMLPDNYVVSETLTGTQNGTNTIFTFKAMPYAGSIMIFKNGALIYGAGVDYSISYDTVTFVAAPISTDKIRVTYYKLY